jgi:hypothetical protein
MARPGRGIIRGIGGRRIAGPPVLVGQRGLVWTITTPPTAYTLNAAVANIDFQPGSHSMVVTRKLVAAPANVTFTGGTHITALARKLLAAPANVSFLGGAHALKTGRKLTSAVANITFLGGSHTLTYTPGVAHVVLTAAPANVTFQGSNGNTLTYTNNAPPPFRPVRYVSGPGTVHIR